MSDTDQTESVPSSEPQNLSEHIEANFDAKRKELGVEDGLKDIPGVTMLVTFLLIAPPMILRVGANPRTERPSGMQVSSIASACRVKIARQSL